MHHATALRDNLTFSRDGVNMGDILLWGKNLSLNSSKSFHTEIESGTVNKFAAELPCLLLQLRFITDLRCTNATLI